MKNVQVRDVMGTETTLILSRRGTPNPEAEAKEQALAEWGASLPGVEVILTPHLYHLPDDAPIWRELARVSQRVVLLSWLHPRAMEWLLRRRGVDVSGWQFFNLAAFADLEAVRAALGDVLKPKTQEKASKGVVRELGGPTRPRWYPVIDYSRCTSCQHCLQFCLFGVYALAEDGQVEVRSPDSCKPGCPACSRICPQGAILFPLYDRDEAIAGAPGKVMQPDSAARRLFYTRTGRRCPACGGDGSSPGVLPKPAEGQAVPSLCPECGRPVRIASSEGAVTDELDALIDALERLARRKF